MQKIIRSYYLDKPLTKKEVSFVSKVVNQREFKEFFKDLREILILEQIRVPGVLPSPGPNGKYYKEGEPEKHISLVRKNLRRAGITSDISRQVVWVIPKEIYWGGIFQLAIYEETGFYPYAVQRWRFNNNKLIKGEIRVIDVHGLMGGKEE